MQLRMFNALTLVVLVITYYRLSECLPFIVQTCICTIMLIGSIVDAQDDD
jgi:hypothetical protein